MVQNRNTITLFRVCVGAVVVVFADQNLCVRVLLFSSPRKRCYYRYSTRTDVYSFGMCLFEILIGERPWNGLSNHEVKKRKYILLFQASAFVCDYWNLF